MQRYQFRHATNATTKENHLVTGRGVTGVLTWGLTLGSALSLAIGGCTSTQTEPPLSEPVGEVVIDDTSEEDDETADAAVDDDLEGKINEVAETDENLGNDETTSDESEDELTVETTGEDVETSGFEEDAARVKEALEGVETADGGTIGENNTPVLARPKTGSSDASQPEAAWVYVDNSRVRNAPSLKAKTVRRIAYGAPVQITTKQNGFAQIGPEEYVLQRNLTNRQGEFVEKGTNRIVSASDLNVRDQPSIDGNIVGRLTKGEAVTVVSEQDGWAKLAEGRYVAAKFLRQP